MIPILRRTLLFPGTTAIPDTGDRGFHADIAAVPEPSAALLGVMGVLALGRRRRA